MRPPKRRASPWLIVLFSLGLALVLSSFWSPSMGPPSPSPTFPGSLGALSSDQSPPVRKTMSPSPSTSHFPMTPASKLPLRVICAVMRNEVRFVREWLEFHHSVGFNRIVVYDDQSDDGLDRVLAEYPYVVRIPVDWKYEIPADGQHKQRIMQVDAYTRCLETYWKNASMIAVIDVDEFMFPARESWDKPDMLQASLDATKRRHQQFINRRSKPVQLDPPGFAFVNVIPCVKFGFNGHEWPHNGSMLDNYLRREYYRVDNGTLANVIETRWMEPDSRSFPPPEDPALTAACQAAPTICRDASHVSKTIYFPNGQSAIVKPNIHNPQRPPNWRYMYDMTFSRKAGFACNHYRFRSRQELIAKLLKNANHHEYNFTEIKMFNVSSPAWKYWERIEDREIVGLKQTLAQRAVPAREPRGLALQGQGVRAL